MSRGQPRTKGKTPRPSPPGRGGAHVSGSQGTAAARRSPRQQRARATVEAIAEAAELVIVERGYARATTNLIASRAGVSIGSLYQYFPNKEAILRALVERHTAQLEPIINQALRALARPDVPVTDALSDMFARIVELHGRRPHLNRVLGEYGPLPPVIEKMHRDGEMAIAHRLAAILEARPDVRRGDHLVMAYALGQAAEALSRWVMHDAPETIDKDVFVQEAVRMLARYVVKDDS